MDFERQLGIFNPDRTNANILIVGVGGIGSWVAEGLARLGISQMTLVDPDTIEAHNLPTQRYHEKAVGGYKALEMARSLSYFPCEFTPIIAKFVPHLVKGFDIVISAVDNMATRKEIYDACVAYNIPFFVDGRIGRTSIGVHTVTAHPASRKFYEEFLFTDDQAQDTGCTERAIIDVAFLVSGLMVGMVRKYLTGLPTPRQAFISADGLNLIQVA
jgi:molybdopterin/thiamine biosynthesis adenylyltransferase